MNKGEQTEQTLIDFTASCFNSLLRYVMGALPWEAGEGPDTWQIEVMKDIEKSLKEGI